MIGRILDDRYAIVRLLGQGGMGAVYEARHTGTGRRVAVKIILGNEARQEDQIARFHREARAVGAVESDFIAQVFDTGRDRETSAPYIAMEFLEGEDVQALIGRLGPLPVDLALRIALQACLGLERAHAAGVIHRDIKPANLFIARKEQGQRVVKLLDFGIAKMSNSGLNDGGLTTTGTMLGSPLYMSPEQARGSTAIDARSDLWSLGVTLYQCISGHRPNDHVEGLGELILTICSTPAPWLQDVAPWVPPEVAHVVRRALTIDLSARYANAGELAAALRALLPYGYSIVDAMLVPLGATTRSYVAPRAAPLEVSAAVPATTLGTTGSAPAAVKSRPVGLRVGLVGGALAVAIAGGSGIYWSVQRGAAPAASASASPATTAIATPPSTPAQIVAAQPPASPASPASIAPPSTSAAPSVSAPPSAIAIPLRPATPRPSNKPPPPPRPRNDEDETSRK
jgi:eukaryotic-like serine/threonine-protein kinase